VAQVDDDAHHDPFRAVRQFADLGGGERFVIDGPGAARGRAGSMSVDDHGGLPPARRPGARSGSQP
jgi:hypothetical protein